jgi:hypothetical protein
VGVSLPFGLTCLILLFAGVFKTFSFWVFTYAAEYASEVSSSSGVQIFMGIFPTIVGPAIGVWIIAALGLTTLVWNRENRAHAGFIGGFLLCSFLAVCPGLFFREHYFIVMLPVVALLAGIAVYSATNLVARAGCGWALTAAPVLLFLAAFGHSVVQQRASLFEMDPLRACHEQYVDNPFPEAVVIGQYLHARTSASDPIAVLGSEPEIYFYAKRHSATGFLYMYGLMEQQEYAFEMQKQMINEIESARPRFLVVVKVYQSWFSMPGSTQLLSFTAWANNYLDSQYELVGTANWVNDHTEYHWDDEAKSYRQTSRRIVAVFKRKG